MRISLPSKLFFVLPCLMVLMMMSQQTTVYAVDAVHEDLPLPAPVRMTSDESSLIWTVDTLQKWTTEHWWGTGDSLVLIGDLENPTDQVACTVQGDFKSLLDGEEHDSDPSEMMDDIKDTLELDYVGGWVGVCVKARSSKRVYVAFEGASEANKTKWETFAVLFFGEQFPIVPQLDVLTATPSATVPATKMTLTAMAGYITQTAAARPVATNTPALFFPTALPVQAEIESAYAQIDGITSVDMVSVRGGIAYAEITHRVGASREVIANQMLRTALQVTSDASLNFSVIFTDGKTCADWMFDLETDDWRVTALTCPK